MSDWQSHLLETDAEIDALLAGVRSVAVLGIKTAESRAPAFYVPEYAQRAGLKIYPVPVYYPDVTEILVQPVFGAQRFWISGPLAMFFAVVQRQRSKRVCLYHRFKRTSGASLHVGI